MRTSMYDILNDLNNVFYEGGYKGFPIDVIEIKNGYEVNCELAGVDKKDINIEFDEGTLTITANPVKANKDTKYLIHERNDMKLRRSIYFGDINEDSLKAKYENGILNVIITTKAPEVKEKKQIVIE